ncbi:MAG: hypothetical protein WDM90_08930 [Ferruginibacter sp.]
MAITVIVYINCLKQKKQLTKLFYNSSRKFVNKISVDNNTAIEWEEEGKEFKLNGEMYDVVRTTYENGKTWLHCFGDKNEDKVLAKFQSVIKNSIGNSSD